MNIELRKWSEEYFARICEIFTRCDRSCLSDGIPMPYTEAHARGWYENTVLPRDEKDGLYRIIFADAKPVGQISVACYDDIRARDAEMGYILLDEYKGQGIMTQAVAMACAEAFGKLDILRITAEVFSPNTASCRVLEKNGFQLEGTLRRAVCKDGNVHDMCIYGKLKQS
jgi:ribosomal-protein-alanine N-acetyltransferase